MTTTDKQRQPAKITEVKDTNAAIYLQAARELGLTVDIVSAPYSYFTITKGAKRLFIYHNAISLSDVATRRMTHNKYISQKIFRENGIPVPNAKLFYSREIQAIIRYATKHRPIVIKPAKGSRSVGVTVDPKTDADIRQAINDINRERIMVEKMIDGADYRVLIFNGKIMDIITWVPPSITGNNMDSIEALVKEKNRYFRDRNLYQIVIDHDYLASQKLDLKFIPDKGQRILLNKSNEHTVGAEAVQIDQETVHPDNIAMFIKAATVSGLNFAGLDFMSPDLSVSYKENSAAVNEINSAPHIWPHFYAGLKEDTTVIKDILSSYFADTTTATPVLRTGETTEHQTAGAAERSCKNIAGIVRGKWSHLENKYYVEALHYYDEVIYIDPRRVTYTTNRETGNIEICHEGRLLNDLSMLYTLGRIPETLILVKYLQLVGCPISDPYETIARDCLEKLADTIAMFDAGIGITTHVLISHELATVYLSNLDKSFFPLLNKPVRGNKGKGIVALNTPEEAISFSAEHFKESDDWLVFEQLMRFVHEYRIYLVDGKPVELYEKVRHDNRIVMNLHQGAKPGTVAEPIRQDIFSWLNKHLPARYQLGVYGIDLAVTAAGDRYIIEINRTPGFGGLKRLGLLNFPRYVHKILSRRARMHAPVKGPTPTYLISLLGDTNPGETYQARLEEKGNANILKDRGYEYGFQHFKAFLSESDFSVVNLEACITDERTSPFADNKPYLDWTDSSRTPALLKKLGIKAVSLANNHTFDFGEQGMADMLTILRQNDIASFGAGMSDEQAAQALHHHFSLADTPLHLIIASGYEFQNPHVRRGYYAEPYKAGVNLWSEANARSQLSTLRQNYPEAFIIAFPHWGSNYTDVVKRQERLARILIEAGADLIVGHGSHMLQGISTYQGRWIIYGIGNFVYHSPGRFHRHDVLPFGSLCRLEIVETNDQPVIRLRLYPTHIDNKSTGYQSDFISEQQFRQVLSLLMPTRGVQTGLERKLSSGRDQHGYYLSVNVPWHKDKTAAI